MISFDKISVSDAKSLLSVPSYYDENRAFFDGDHWQKGKGFADKIAPPDAAEFTVVKEGLERIFVPENHIREIVKRRTDGVLARTPRWEYVRKSDDPDTPREDLLLPKVTTPVKKWFADREAHSKLKDLIDEGSLQSTGMLRLYIPPARLGDIDNIRSPEEALDLIYVDVVQRSVGKVYTDTFAMRDIGVINFRGPAFTDVVSAETNTSQNQSRLGEYVEVTYVNPDTGRTQHKLLFNDERPEQSTDYDLGGRLLMYEIDEMLLISEPIKQLQRTINTTRTHMALNNRETNFQQRIFLNAQPPGTVIVDPETGKKTLQVEAVPRGADKDMWIVGVEQERMDGSPEYKDPRLEVINPTDPRGYIESAGELRRGLYREAKQLHIELIKDATSTGEARMQAAADFEQDLNDVKGILDAAGKWLLETVWMLAQNLAGKTPDNEIEADFDCHITLGPVPVERMRAQIELKTARLMSTYTAMNRNGIINPEAEMQRIRDEETYQLEIKKLKIEVLSVLQRAGIETEQAAELAGFSPDERKLLVEVEVDEEGIDAGQRNGQSANTPQATANR